MSKPASIKPFDAAKYLDSPAAISAFLNDALESNDITVIQMALEAASKAIGMTAVAEAAGVGRESLYKALKPGVLPRFDTVMKVISALGLKLSATPLPQTGVPKVNTIKTPTLTRSRSGKIRRAAGGRASTPPSRNKPASA